MVKVPALQMGEQQDRCYFDCFSGISGDMILGSLVDAGLPMKKLIDELSHLPIGGYDIEAKKVRRSGFTATKVDVILKGAERKPLRRSTGTSGKSHRGRRWKDIEGIIMASSYSPQIRNQGLLIFRRLFKAEAKVHGGNFHEIHLHETGAIDCLVDVFGTLAGLNIMGIKEIYMSPVNLGSGWVQTAHGLLPVPAPATAELLRDIPVYSSGIEHELTTPTGAAIISCLAKDIVPFPPMKISRVGMGAGGKNFKGHPNVLRFFVGSVGKGPKGMIGKDVVVIETNIDDMNPQVYEFVMEKLFSAGALDVSLIQIIMKKGRPGVRLTVLSRESDVSVMTRIILTETTTIGVRFYTATRQVLERIESKIRTRFGNIRVKVSKLDGTVIKTTPEYDECRAIALEHNIPLLDVIREIRRSSK